MLGRQEDIMTGRQEGEDRMLRRHREDHRMPGRQEVEDWMTGRQKGRDRITECQEDR